MRKLFTILSLAVALLAVSCSEDTTTDLPIGGNGTTDSPVEGDEPMTYITVGIDDNTRIGVGEEENGKVPLYWSEGDKLVVNKTTTSGAVSAEYAGKNTAVIGVPETTSYPMTLVYPSAVRKGAKWFFIDAEQTYNPAKLANGWAILMGVAEEAGDVVRLEHMCGYMKVSLTGSTTVKRVMLRTIGHEPISGYFKYPTTSTTDGKLGIGMVRFNGDNALANGYYDSPVIAINCGDGVALSGEATDFYFALPASTYSKGFELTIVDAAGKQQRHTAYTSSGKEVVAGSLIVMPTLTVDCKEDQGIYNGNELAGYVRTLEKDVWLDVTDGTTLHLRGELDLTNEDFSDVDNVNESSELFYWRIDGEDRYNCGSITTIDGHGNAITNYNGTVSAAAAGLLFHEIPATMTVKNLTLGKTADNPATSENEADCTLTATGSGTGNNCFGAFCCNLLGTIEGCASYAKVDIQGATKGGLRVGGFHCGTSPSVGTVSGSTNYGYIYCDAKSTSAGYVIVGGIAASDIGEVANCTNAGPVTVVNSARAVYVGGVVGYADVERGLTGCSNSGAITLTYPKASSRIGGVVGYTKTLVTSCTNTGAVTAHNNKNEGETLACHIGGVVGSSAYTNQTLNGCVNGEKNTTKGAVTVNTGKGRGNAYVGGVLGYCDADIIVKLNNVTNYAPVTCEAAKVFYMGGVVGDSNKASSTYEKCYNYGALSIAETNSTSWSYLGGVFGRIASGTTAKTLTNKGDITANIPSGTVRLGGLCGYFSTTTSGVAECDITVEAAGAGSNIGGLGGYAPGKTITGCSYKGTITCKEDDATVMVGGIYGIANGATITSSSLNATIVNTGSATCGLVTTAPLTNGSVLNLGAADKPLKISPSTVFCNVSVTGADKVSVNPEAGKANLVNDAASTNKYTVNQTNVQYAE